MHIIFFFFQLFYSLKHYLLFQQRNRAFQLFFCYQVDKFFSLYNTPPSQMLFYYIWLLSECQEFYEFFYSRLIDIFMKLEYNVWGGKTQFILKILILLIFLQHFLYFQCFVVYFIFNIILLLLLDYVFIVDYNLIRKIYMIRR